MLSVYAKLSHEEYAALGRIGRAVIREVSPRRDIIHEGGNPDVIHLILDGWACRYKSLLDGRRQTLAIFIPGDVCDPNIHVLKNMDHSVGAITHLKFAEISRAQIDRLTARYPRITQALRWNELVESSIQREWILNMGRRNAHEHLAHLIVELFHRLRAVGLTRADSCEFPLTHNDLADATGHSSVHVNRVLQDFKRDRLIELDSRRIRIPDLERLERAALFNPNYLHLDHEGAHLDAGFPDPGAPGSNFLQMPEMQRKTLRQLAIRRDVSPT
jgi:CRP-like cAMP-binding protein